MNLDYRMLPESEAGTAVDGCGTIHISEIKPTLKKLSDDLDFPFDLNDYTLGSTGKKEYSGDLDVVLDNKLWENGPRALKENLDQIFEKDRSKLSGNMVHLRYPIVDYDSSKNQQNPRTGYVQVDFNFGNSEWKKFYHYSAGDKSRYKGAHRNLALAAISYLLDRWESMEKDSYNRPVSEIRYKWGPDGLTRIKRKSIKDQRTDRWLKKREDIILAGPYTDPDLISKTIFSKSGKISDLESLESIIDAVKKNYESADQEIIWKRIAYNFSDWKDGKFFNYPHEIEKYI